jgi:phage replication-related protein YjqB (UPF0714/DUF867 family)
MGAEIARDQWGIEMTDKYSCFSDLAASEVLGVDYEIVARRRPASLVAVIAPHGGGIELETSEIAERIAGVEFSLYCFRGLKRGGNRDLHITSHRFNEPECLALIADHDRVLAIHGCSEPGERALLGGLDKPFIRDLESALRAAGIAVQTTDHPFPGEHPNNVCNRGARRAGAQFELTRAFRQGRQVPLFIHIVRDVLMGAGS